MNRISLQTRITAGLAVSLALIFTLQWWVASGSARHVVENKISSNLGHEVENFLAATKLSPGAVELEAASVGQVYQRVYSGHYYLIRAEGNELRSRSLWDEGLPDLPDGLRRITGPRGRTLLVKTASFIKQGRPLKIIAAEDVTDIDLEIDAFRNRYAIVAAFTLAALLLAQIAIVRMALAPLNRARLDADRLERGETDTIVDDVPAELVPFVSRINRLTEITRKRLARSRNALGDLAHALKTPLTALVQAADSERIKRDPELHDLLTETTDTMKRLMEKELRKARLAGAFAPGKGFFPEKDVPPLLNTLGMMYREKAINTQTALSSGGFSAFDAEDMIELLGTLLDNAYKWANGRVRISVAGGNAMVIEIEDDGPGCPPDKLALIVERGFRLDENVPGYGLGLAIARDIVESYNGGISFTRSEMLGGLKVKVALPTPGGSIS